MNPFTPGNGVEPKYLAGRKDFLREFERSLQAFADGLPQNTVVYGLRGTGKTVLAKHFKLIAEASGWAVIEREFDEKYVDETLFGDSVGADVAAKAAEVSVKKRLAEAGKKILDSIKPETLTAYGVTYKPFYAESRRLLVDHLKEAMLRNWPIFQKAGKTGVLLLFDEMHSIHDLKEKNQYVLSALLEALSHVQREGCRFYLCACGLPTLKTNLKEAKTYSERMFNFQEVGNLPPNEARKALSEPLKEAGYSFDESLTGKLVSETAGYPYFLQFYGYYTIDKTGKTRISLQDFNGIHSSLLERLDKSFFEDRFNLASDNERSVITAMAKTGETDIPITEISKKAKISYNSLMQLVVRLTEKGLIYRVRRGKYAFTLPLFAEYIRRTT